MASEQLNNGNGCHVCGAARINMVEGFEALLPVTSDCKPARPVARLGVCPRCGCAQKVLNAAWREETDRIYSQYTLYQQGAGFEPLVFHHDGASLLRSELLLDKLFNLMPWPETGRLLDVGCGNGAVLRAFSQRAPGWTLFGSELSDTYCDTVKGIPGVEDFYCCGPDEIPGAFGLITMMHVFEHITDPRAFLVNLRRKLEPDGAVIMQTMLYPRSPFDLMIFDHCTHFTPDTASSLFRNSGYDVMLATGALVPKEVTVVARAAAAPPAESAFPPHVAETSARTAAIYVDWLRAFASQAVALRAGAGALGIFGSSIAATWLFLQLGGDAAFFVDEDPHRAGQSHLDRPIHTPENIPDNAHVIIALPPEIAAAVAARIQRPGITCHVPPPLP